MNSSSPRSIKARDGHAKHERSMQTSGQQMAALQAEAKQLESLIEQDVTARKAAAAEVKAIASKWQWPEVNEKSMRRSHRRIC